ncbi:Serine/threonine-protein phosphatase 2A regulatory subunit B'' subunit gamma like protein [Aduncisulcus paluster]|uniref:Serine/threonine-protein phosphatase 2A regulatory subunit B'' subunit gamma like protein n=1 Tax=Aduncisulcus paluster TaxID=2918883 RepID=A0ABQ5K4C5_9EUKA|nr:Serine/threonine-protein phosphatase 2A regulatory subunit B'' subunit gamma like protein [Aduncisulcus paluster]
MNLSSLAKRLKDYSSKKSKEPVDPIEIEKETSRILYSKASFSRFSSDYMSKQKDGIIPRFFHKISPEVRQDYIEYHRRTRTALLRKIDSDLLTDEVLAELEKCLSNRCRNAEISALTKKLMLLPEVAQELDEDYSFSPLLLTYNDFVLIGDEMKKKFPETLSLRRYFSPRVFYSLPNASCLFADFKALRSSLTKVIVDQEKKKLAESSSVSAPKSLDNPDIFELVKNLIDRVSTLCSELDECDPSSVIKADDLLYFITRDTHLQRMRISLSIYDSEGAGYLCEEDLDVFVCDSLKSMPEVNALIPVQMEKYYRALVIEYFMFFLDKKRRGIIKVDDLAASPILEKFLDSTAEAIPDELAYFAKDEPPNLRELETLNWLHPKIAVHRIYILFLSLDSDKSGLLTKEDFQAIHDQGLNPVIASRVFYVLRTFDGLLDMKGYIQFLLAVCFPKEERSKRFFFDLFDLTGQGRVTNYDIHSIFKGIAAQINKYSPADEEDIGSEDVITSVFDSLEVRDEERKEGEPRYFELSDVLSSKSGHLYPFLLLSASSFLDYESREKEMLEHFVSHTHMPEEEAILKSIGVKNLDIIIQTHMSFGGPGATRSLVANSSGSTGVSGSLGLDGFAAAFDKIKEM